MASQASNLCNPDSFMAAWLGRLKIAGTSDTEHSEEVVRNVAAAALLAGTETVRVFNICFYSSQFSY